MLTLPAVVLLLAVAAGCSTDAALPEGDPPALPGTDATTKPTAAPTVPATTSPPTTAVCDQRPRLDAGLEPVPGDLRARVDEALADPRFAGVQSSISVWVEGYGEVAAVAPDDPLLPASNQKLMTAVGSRLLLDPAGRFRTEVRRTPDGSGLVLVAGGDPTLQAEGLHSLAALAAQVRGAGVDHATTLTVDVSRFDSDTALEGWQDWQIPTYSGPLSALTVDDNRDRTDAAYLADPATGNAEVFATALRAAGVTVDGPVLVETRRASGITMPSPAATGPVVAALDSAPFAELSRDMLTRSDNEIAEALVRELGGGSTPNGVARIAVAVEPWCLHLTGRSGDGSGLSRSDLRSAREWRRLLQALEGQPWASEVVSGLPVAGRSGTLLGRLRGPATIDNVRAKTGTIIGGSSLSGYATTADGRAVVFSIVVNGDPPAAQRAIGAIDRLVTAVVSP